MASFEIIAGGLPEFAEAEGNVHECFEVLVDGESLTSACPAGTAASLLRELLHASLSVLEGRAPKALVSLPEPGWELCLAAHPEGLALSHYRSGPLPEVRRLDRLANPTRMALELARTLKALEPELAPAAHADLRLSLARLERAAQTPTPVECPAEEHTLRGPLAGRGGPLQMSFEARWTRRPGPLSAGLHTDLHALLLPGRLLMALREHTLALPEGYLFLHAERLVALCRPLLDARAGRRAVHLRAALGEVMLGLRLGATGRLALSLGEADRSVSAAALEVSDFVLPVATLARGLCSSLAGADRSYARNLRVRTLRREARALLRMCRTGVAEQGTLNPDPERYRSAALPMRTSARNEGLNLAFAARLRFDSRWTAEVAELDLSGTLPCGDRLVVSGGRELCAIDRASGSLLWSRNLPRAATTLAGEQILRLSPRGEVELRESTDGELCWQGRIEPRIGPPALAFALSAAGLPRVAVLAEGERGLIALDLHTGEPRWRHVARAGGSFRFRRVGRLVVFACGDGSLTALDIGSGAVVWRHVEAESFSLAPCASSELVLALAGTPGRGSARLVAIDAFRGEKRWVTDLRGAPRSVPVFAAGAAVAVVERPEGAVLVGVECERGAVLFQFPLGPVAAGRTIALNAFDELVVANLPDGRVVGIDAAMGTQRFARTVFPPGSDDVPRRLDTQLKHGVLFVPQARVAVLRPADGALLGALEGCELVPDMLRIDDAGFVYVGEESGHLACHELTARMGLVAMPGNGPRNALN